MARTGKAPRHFAESRKSQPIKLGSRDFLIAEIATRIINACADFNVGARRSKLIKAIGCALHQHGKIAFCGIFFLLHCHAPTRATTILGRQCDLYGGILDTRGSADDCYEGDLAELMLATAENRLGTLPAPKFGEAAALTVVMAASGYPDTPKKGGAIGGIAEAEATGAKVFHAGTALIDGQLVANGGRVLNVTARGGSVGEAQKNAYAAVNQIDFPDGFCRGDIGWREVAREAMGKE